MITKVGQPREIVRPKSQTMNCVPCLFNMLGVLNDTYIHINSPTPTLTLPSYRHCLSELGVIYIKRCSKLMISLKTSYTV